MTSYHNWGSDFQNVLPFGRGFQKGRQSIWYQTEASQKIWFRVIVTSAVLSSQICDYSTFHPVMTMVQWCWNLRTFLNWASTREPTAFLVVGVPLAVLVQPQFLSIQYPIEDPLPCPKCLQSKDDPCSHGQSTMFDLSHLHEFKVSWRFAKIQWVK